MRPETKTEFKPVKDPETLYANLNYICRHAENAQRPNRPYIPGRQLP